MRVYSRARAFPPDNAAAAVDAASGTQWKEPERERRGRFRSSRRRPGKELTAGWWSTSICLAVEPQQVVPR